MLGLGLPWSAMEREPEILPLGEALRRTELDRELLADEVGRHPGQALTEPYGVAQGPLGDACESLRDLVAHVLMWDEINLAVLTEAGRARRHWSLDPRWETREAGQALNAAGVAAGRELPVTLLLHRFATVRDALLSELRSHHGDGWLAPLPLGPGPAHSPGSLAQYVMTVPGAAPYWHAAIHLGRLAEVGAPARAR
jgi:Mycothiol maleylpyruvate isomerase N-terminal domain